MIETIDYWNATGSNGFFKSSEDGPNDLPWDDIDVCIDHLADRLVSRKEQISGRQLERILVLDEDGVLQKIVIVDLENWCINFEPEYLE